jgi:hypothetical protein
MKYLYIVGIVFFLLISCTNTVELTKEKELSEFKAKVEREFHCNLTVYEEVAKSGTFITICLEYSIYHHHSLPKNLEQGSKSLAQKFYEEYEEYDIKNTIIIVVHKLVEKSKEKDFELIEVLNSKRFKFKINGCVEQH